MWRNFRRSMEMASSAPGSEMGTGGMVTKIKAARIATASGVDMIIANGKDFGIRIIFLKTGLPEPF